MACVGRPSVTIQRPRAGAAQWRPIDTALSAAQDSTPKSGAQTATDSLRSCDSKGQWHPLVHVICMELLHPSHMVHCQLSQRGTLVIYFDSSANRVANASPVRSDQVAQVDGGVCGLIKQGGMLGLQMKEQARAGHKAGRTLLAMQSPCHSVTCILKGVCHCATWSWHLCGWAAMSGLCWGQRHSRPVSGYAS